MTQQPDGKNWLSQWPWLVLGLVIVFALYAVGAAILNPGPEQATQNSPAPEPPNPEALFAGWRQEAPGFEAALKEHEETGKPVLVYFHDPRCRFCQKFNASIMVDPDFQAFIGKNVIPVKITPGHGEAEYTLFMRFSAPGTPALFIKYPAMERFAYLPHAHRETGRFKTADEFIEDIRQAEKLIPETSTEKPE